MANNLIMYGYKFKESQISPKYSELPEGHLFFATSSFFDKHIPNMGGSPLFNIYSTKIENIYYIGVITRKYYVGEELKPDDKNPCFLPDSHVKILQKGWNEANLLNQSFADISPSYYYL
jgi:hypothetical protein